MEQQELEIYRHYANQLPAIRNVERIPKIQTLTELCPHFDAFFFDGFGTLYNLSERHPGSKEALQFLRSQGKCIRLVTNAASRPVKQLKRHLEEMEIFFEESEIICSGDLLQEKNQVLGIKKALHLGREPALPFFKQAGIEPSDSTDLSDVILTSVSSHDHEPLEKAKSILQKQGARLVVLNPDAWAPKLDGTRIPVSGTAAWNLHLQTGCELILLGKPFPEIFLKTIQSSGFPSHRCIMIGDTLGTDILGAQRVGLATGLILSGNSSEGNIKNDEIALGVLPDFYLEHI